MAATTETTETSNVDEKQLDLTVFEHATHAYDQDGECNAGDTDFRSCLPMKRLLAALRYYSLLNVLQNDNDCKVFEDFVFSVYSKRALINDYVHLSEQHEAHIEDIRLYFVVRIKLLPECNLTQCALTQRHQHVKHEQAAVDVHPQLAQVCDLFDSVHFYVLHLFEVGMRRTRKERDGKQTTTSDLHGVEAAMKHFDAEFARLTAWISARQHLTNSFDRFSSGTNSKFEVKLTASSGKHTFLDSVFKQLQQTAAQQFAAMINDEDYDTESVQLDVLNQDKPGNISRVLNDKRSVSVIRNLFQSAKDSASSFAAGFRFYYWSDFKTKTKEQDRNHREYTVSQLYVTQKYSSFKEEIANYEAEKFDLTKYNNKVRVKALDFITSNIVKKTKAKYNGYGISEGSTLAFRHLASLSMYCDFTHLSSKFSATFRKSHPFELLHETKRRNSEFWWFARSLRETVEIFGKNYSDTKWDKYPFVGPFYCGLSFVMTVPQFSVRLNGPTSTTMYEAVALKFSGPKGIILTLNNWTPKGSFASTQFLRGFDCSWLSRYREEAERLFFGGYLPINIQSINIIKTKQNFADIICGLCYLDKLLSGQDTRGDEISEHQIAIFVAIYQSFCGASATHIELDAYIEQTLQQFVHNKTHITLDLYYLSRYANKEMAKLIMNEIEKNEDKAIRSKDDQTNLPRAALLKTFRNVKEININTVLVGSISFLLFLELITGSSVTKAVIKGDKGGWLDKLWSNEKEREEIMSAYKQQNYQLQYVKEKGECIVSKIM